MPATLIVVPLLLLAAPLIRRIGVGQPLLVKAFAVLAPLTVVGLLIFQIVSHQSVSPDSFWHQDGIACVAVAVAGCVPLVVGLIESSPVLLAATFWSAGMLALCSLSDLPVVQWGALQFSVIPLLFYGRTPGSGLLGMVRSHSTLLLGSGMFGAGFLLLNEFDVESPAATIGTVLLLCGLGGMLGWFPFPRLESGAVEDDLPGAVFGKRYLPLLTAGVLVFRLVERQSLTTYQANLLALAAMFSLALCGARLLQEERLSRRLILSALSTFSFLLIAICLQNWEVAHADRDWQFSSNIPTGKSILIAILACETAGLLVLACGFRLMNPENGEGDFSQTLAGSASRRPLAAVSSIGGLLTLAGIPPLPGFWWRFSLIAAMLLPHRQSNVTQVTEADHAFSLLAVLLVGLLALNSLGHLRLLQQMLLEEPFRVRGERRTSSVRLATAMSLMLLIGIACVPLSLGTLVESADGELQPLNSHKARRLKAPIQQFPSVNNVISAND